MRRIILSLVLMIGGFCAAVIHAEETKNSESNIAKIEKSEKKWQELKKKYKGIYSYKKTFSSWVGFGHETTIVVRNNKVVERHYREWDAKGVPMALVQPGQKPKPEKPRERIWVEKGDKVGSHKKGAKPLTLDELYREAMTIAGKTLSQHEKMYVHFDKQGLLNSCFYVNTMIADDAPKTGVSISNIKLDPPRVPAEPENAPDKK